MKLADMNAAIAGTPQMRAVFRVEKPSPRLVRMGVQKGDLFYYAPTGCYVPVMSGCKWNTVLGASQVSFVEYRDINHRV